MELPLDAEAKPKLTSNPTLSVLSAGLNSNPQLHSAESYETRVDLRILILTQAYLEVIERGWFADGRAIESGHDWIKADQ